MYPRRKPRIDLRSCGTPHVLRSLVFSDAPTSGALTYLFNSSCLFIISSFYPL